MGLELSQLDSLSIQLGIQLTPLSIQLVSQLVQMGVHLDCDLIHLVFGQDILAFLNLSVIRSVNLGTSSSHLR